MTKQGIFDRPMANKGKPQGTGVVIVASPEEVDRLGPDVGGTALSGVTTLPVPPASPLPLAKLADARLIVLEVDTDSAASMQRLIETRDAFPSQIVIAAIRNPTVSLVRALVHQGVADVVSLPFERAEVLQVALDALARHDAQTKPATTSAPLLSVVRSIGGCGATTIATHVAAALAKELNGGAGVCLADLDIQFGTACDYLGVTPHGRLDDLLDAGARLDEDLLQSVAVAVEDQLSVIAAPDGILPLEQVDVDQLLRVIALLRQRFAAVVLDLPADWTNWTLSAAAQSSAILMVVETTLPSIRQAKRRLDLFRSVGIEDSAIAIVVNRAEKRLFGTIDLADVSNTLGREVLGSVALDQQLVSAAQNQGKLVGAFRAKSRFATDIARLAQVLASGQLQRA